MTPDVRIITPWFGHFSGGAEVAARRYAQELARRGLSVELLATACQSPFHNWWEDQLPVGEEPHEQAPNLVVRRFPVDKGGRADYEALLSRVLRGETLAPDEYHVLARSSCNSAALLDHAAARPAGVTLALPYTQGLAYSAAEVLGDALTLMPCLHDEGQLYWPSTRAMIGRARNCAFLSAAEKRLAIREHGLATGRRLVESPVVGLGVDAPAAPGPAPVDGPYIVYVGRKDAGKGLPQLLEWMGAVWARMPDLKLVLVGGGNGVALPPDPRVVDLGFVDPAVKSGAIRGARALVNPSALESFSIVIFEAWLLGVPVFVNAKCDVTTEFVTLSGGGFAVSDADEMIDGLSVLADPVERGRLGEAGRHFARMNTAWDVVANRFVEALLS